MAAWKLANQLFHFESEEGRRDGMAWQPASFDDLVDVGLVGADGRMNYLLVPREFRSAGGNKVRCLGEKKTHVVENVGGAVFDAVLPLLNTGARVPVCGLVSQYNATSLPAGPDRLSMLMGQVLRKRLTVRGFIIFQDFGHLYPEFVAAMSGWLASGQMHYVEEMIEGLERAPQAFIGLLRGENFGKRVIHVGAEKMIDSRETAK